MVISEWLGVVLSKYLVQLYGSVTPVQRNNPLKTFDNDWNVFLHSPWRKLRKRQLSGLKCIQSVCAWVCLCVCMFAILFFWFSDKVFLCCRGFPRCLTDKACWFKSCLGTFEFWEPTFIPELLAFSHIRQKTCLLVMVYCWVFILTSMVFCSSFFTQYSFIPLIWYYSLLVCVILFFAFVAIRLLCVQNLSFNFKPISSDIYRL